MEPLSAVSARVPSIHVHKVPASARDVEPSAWSQMALLAPTVAVFVGGTATFGLGVRLHGDNPYTGEPWLAASAQVFLLFDPAVLSYAGHTWDPRFGLDVWPNPNLNPPGTLNLMAGITPYSGQEPVPGTWRALRIMFELLNSDGDTRLRWDHDHQPESLVGSSMGLQIEPMRLTDSGPVLAP